MFCFQCFQPKADQPRAEGKKLSVHCSLSATLLFFIINLLADENSDKKNTLLVLSKLINGVEN